MKIALNRFLLLALLACLLPGLMLSAQAQTDKPQDQSAPASTVEKQNAGASVAEQQRQQLLKALEDDSPVWLEAQGKQFLGLWEPDNSGASFGAILILHGEGQTPDWPGTISPLRTSIIKYGWSTLAIELPDPDPTNNSEALAQARIETAIRFLDQQGQLNLVMFGVGVSASRGMEYIKKQPANADNSSTPVRGPFRALIMVNARNTSISREFNLPTLDLYYDEHYLDAIEVAERLALANKFQLDNYHQLRILKPDNAEPGDGNRLTRRVRGFLNKYAKGVEVKRR